MSAPSEAVCKWSKQEHAGEIYALRCVEGGAVLSAGHDGTARLWDGVKGKVKRVFEGHTDVVWCMELGPGGLLYTGSGDKSVKAWDISNGKCVRTLTGHAKRVVCLAFGDDGAVYSGSEDKHLLKYTDDGSSVQFKGHRETVLCATMSGSTLFTGGADATVVAWNTTTNAGLYKLKGHSDSVYFIKVVRNILYSGSRDGSIRAWNIDTSECVRVMAEHSARVTAMEVDLQLGVLFSASVDGKVIKWLMDTGEAQAVFDHGGQPVFCIQLVGRLLYTGCGTGLIRAWNINSGELVGTCTGPHDGNWVVAMACSPSAVSTLYSADRNGYMCCWDISDHLAKVPIVSSGARTVVRVSYEDGSVKAIGVDGDATAAELTTMAKAKTNSPDGRFSLVISSGSAREAVNPTDSVTNLLSHLKTGAVFLLVAEGGGGGSGPSGGGTASPVVENASVSNLIKEESRSRRGSSAGSAATSVGADDAPVLEVGASGDIKPTKAPAVFARKEHEGEVYALVYDGANCIITAGADAKVRMWNVDNGTLLRVLDGHAGPIFTAATEKGRLYTGSADKTVRAWDIESGACTDVFDGHKLGVLCLDVANGRVLSGAEDKVIFKHESGQPAQVYKGHKDTIVCCTLAGNLLFTGSSDHSVRSWDIEANAGLVKYAGHTDTVYVVKVFGGVLYSGGRDGDARAWNINSGECIHTFTGHTQRVSALEALANPPVLFTASGDGTIRSWDMVTGVKRDVYEGHGHTVTSLALINTLLVSAASDGSILLWSALEATCLGYCKGHAAAILKLVAVGTKVASVARDGLVAVHDVSSHVLLATELSGSQRAHDGAVRVYMTDGSYRAVSLTTGATIQDLTTAAVASLGLANSGEWLIAAASPEGEESLLDMKEDALTLHAAWLRKHKTRGTKFLLKRTMGSPLLSTSQAAVSLNTSTATMLNTSTTSTLNTSSPSVASRSLSSDAESMAENARLLAKINALNEELAAARRAGPPAGSSSSSASASGGGGGGGGGDGGASQEALTKALSELEATKADLRRVTAELESARASLKSASKGASGVAAEVDRLQGELSAARSATAAAEKATADAVARGDAAVAATEKEARRAAAAAAAAEETLRADLALVQEKYAKVKGELKAALAEVTAKEEEALRVAESHKDIQARVARMEGELREAAEFKESANAQIAEMRQRTAAAERELAETKDLFKVEQRLRIRYYNECEDLKGKIRVYCRVRPISAQELSEGHTDVVSFPDDATLNILDSKGKVREFVFTRTFGPFSTQEEVYEDTAALIQSAADGYNVCIFAYGQTGSGKTHTMTGNPRMPGITPRASREIFQLAEREAGKFQYAVSVYIMELYLDELIDLLYEGAEDGRPKLSIHQDAKGTVSVANVTEVEVRSSDELEAVLERGFSARHVASTLMNKESSRSHLIVTVLITSTNLMTGQVLKGKLSLVDLAGSEQVKKSGATGAQLEEAKAINTSLLSLGNVIHALSSPTPAGHVPYRSNTLTYLMSDSIGGTAKTLMFVNISPASYNVEESTNSLNYALRVKTITNDVSKNIESKEIQRLKAIIKSLKEGGTGGS